MRRSPAKAAASLRRLSSAAMPARGFSGFCGLTSHHTSSRPRRLSATRLIWRGPARAGAAHRVLVAGELLGADGAARRQLACRDADLGAHAEFASVGELGRGVDHDDAGVYFLGEAFGRGPGLG